MQSKRHDSLRRHPGEPAARSAVFEALESRQFMSVAAPSVDPMGAVLATDPAGTSSSSYAPLVAAGTATTDSAAAADVTGVAPDNGGDNPPPAGGGDTAEARSLWDRLKGAAKWVGNHVTATLHSIGIKGTF